MLDIIPNFSSVPVTAPICTFLPMCCFAFFLRKSPATAFGMKSLNASNIEMPIIITANVAIIPSTIFVSPNCCNITKSVAV